MSEALTLTRIPLDDYAGLHGRAKSKSCAHLRNRCAPEHEMINSTRLAAA